MVPGGPRRRAPPRRPAGTCGERRAGGAVPRLDRPRGRARGPLPSQERGTVARQGAGRHAAMLVSRLALQPDRRGGGRALPLAHREDPGVRRARLPGRGARRVDLGDARGGRRPGRAAELPAGRRLRLVRTAERHPRSGGLDPRERARLQSHRIRARRAVPVRSQGRHPGPHRGDRDGRARRNPGRALGWGQGRALRTRAQAADPPRRRGHPAPHVARGLLDRRSRARRHHSGRNARG